MDRINNKTTRCSTKIIPIDTLLLLKLKKQTNLLTLTSCFKIIRVLVGH